MMLIRKHHEDDHRHEVETRQTYIYGLRQVILLRPGTNHNGTRPGTNHDGRRFCLARVIAHGQGDHKGKYTVMYLTRAEDYSRYKVQRDEYGALRGGEVWEESVQDIVHMDGHGTRMTDQSEVLVRYWVDRWREGMVGCHWTKSRKPPIRS